MAKIMYVWELGGGWGHVKPFAGLARALIARGHQVVMAIKDASLAGGEFAEAGIACLPVPLRLQTETGLPHPIAYADILAAVGYLHSSRLAGLLRTWRDLFALVGPDLILFDHAPTALLAARDLGLPRLTFGNGFCHPPPRQPLPPMRYWEQFPEEQLSKREAPVLGSINRALAELAIPALSRLADLFEVEGAMLRTFADLDHYPCRTDGRYFGVPVTSGGRENIDWPVSSGARVYCYLSGSYKYLETFLRACRRTRQRYFVVCADLPGDLQRRYADGAIAFSAEPVAIDRAAAQCDAAVTHGGCNTTSALLRAGKPVLILPRHAEQSILGHLIVALNAGISLEGEAETRLAIERALMRLIWDPSLTQGARSFADRHSGFDDSVALREMVEMVESHLPARADDAAPVAPTSLCPGPRDRGSDDPDATPRGRTYPEFAPRDALGPLVWPAIAEGDSASLLALLFDLEQTQWWPPERLKQRQFAQLGQLVEHAYLSVPVMRKRLRTAGYRAGRVLSQEIWQRLPVLTRAELQALGSELGSSSVPQTHGEIFEVRTSGSTGRPVSVRKTMLAQRFWQALTLRDHLWHGRDLTGTLAAIRYMADHRPMPPEGACLPNWGEPASLVFRSGPCHVLHVVCDVADQIDWLVRCNPDYLLTHPSNARALAETCERKAIRLPRLRGLRTLGEVCEEATRDTCRRVWGVEIQDMYSAQEIGYLALQCPGHTHYHVQSEAAFVEVLDEAGRPCRPGQVGRVVVTPLHNFATPLLRYEVGDFAEVDAPCPCGRGLPVLRRILGRARNLLSLPDGRRMWPAPEIARMREVAPVRQAQIVQRSLERIDVRLAVERELTTAEEDGLRRHLGAVLGHDFEHVGFVYLDEIARSPSGKFEDFLSEVSVAGGQCLVIGT